MKSAQNELLHQKKVQDEFQELLVLTPCSILSARLIGWEVGVCGGGISPTLPIVVPGTITTLLVLSIPSSKRGYGL